MSTKIFISYTFGRFYWKSTKLNAHKFVTKIWNPRNFKPTKINDSTVSVLQYITITSDFSFSSDNAMTSDCSWSVNVQNSNFNQNGFMLNYGKFKLTKIRRMCLWKTVFPKSEGTSVLQNACGASKSKAWQTDNVILIWRFASLVPQKINFFCQGQWPWHHLRPLYKWSMHAKYKDSIKSYGTV